MASKKSGAKKTQTRRGIGVTSPIRVNSYEVMRRAIDDGVRRGLTTAWKHFQQPKGWTAAVESHLFDKIADNVSNEVCEVFNFDTELP